jgi:hypothetical protein
MGFHLEGAGSARGEVGIEGLGQLEVDGAAGGQVELPRAVEGQAALRAQVGVFAGDVKRVQADAFVGQGGVDAALALEMHAGNGRFQVLEAGFAAQLLGVGERARDGDRAGQRRFAAEGLDVGQLEKRIDVEARKLEAGLGLHSRRLSAVWPCTAVRRSSSRVVMSYVEGVVGGVRHEFENADRLPARARLLSVALPASCGSSNVPEPWTENPACRWRTTPVDGASRFWRCRGPGAIGVDLEALGIEVVAAGGGDGCLAARRG